ncbi:Pyrimidine monooxygenase RutA [Frankliniella fusca]|uniref:Pyrimidine monooxygenase RutA n=1 Tax=Frankliniella fusca TaxID=407009 RepID=A0AAE1HEM2_9NEOP|nr:Pyrimidine monooxygenase RutA [Frankliniella fusca]
MAQLPPNLRFKFVLVNGIWLDESKPYMNTTMKPFATELQTLREKGVRWTHPKTKVVCTTHVTAPSFCADAPARAQLQNILSSWKDFHPQQPVVPGEEKKSRRRVYTFEESIVLRTSDRMEQQGLERRRFQLESGRKPKPVKEVKGPSVLSKFPGCDRSTAVFPEYMHLILCLLKEFMTLWFERDGPWSFKEHRDAINESLKRISVPDFVTRIPRSTEHYSKWKANEFRSFLLYFSPIILSKYMKVEYFQHWLLLVASFYLLLQECVPESDVTKANLMLSHSDSTQSKCSFDVSLHFQGLILFLNEVELLACRGPTLRVFCRSFPVLYKQEFYTYYVHQLCHLPLTVQRHGPLHCNSAFMFESFNGTLAKFIHGTKNQGKELVNNIRIAFGVEALRARTLYCSTTNQPLTVELRNEIRNFNFSEEDVNLLHSLKTPVKPFYRAIIRRESFTCSLYTRQKKRNNFTICYSSSSSGGKAYRRVLRTKSDLSDLVERRAYRSDFVLRTRRYGEIKYFCSSDDRHLAIVERLDLDHCNTFLHEDSGVVIKHIIPIKLSTVTEIIQLDQILCKVIRVKNFICLRPNTYEYNL